MHGSQNSMQQPETLDPQLPSTWSFAKTKPQLTYHSHEKTTALRRIYWLLDFTLRRGCLVPTFQRFFTSLLRKKPHFIAEIKISSINLQKHRIQTVIKKQGLQAINSPHFVAIPDAWILSKNIFKKQWKELTAGCDAFFLAWISFNLRSLGSR